MGYVAMLFPFEAQRECKIVLNDGLGEEVAVYVKYPGLMEAGVVEQNNSGAAGRPRTGCKIII